MSLELLKHGAREGQGVQIYRSRWPVAGLQRILGLLPHEGCRKSGAAPTHWSTVMLRAEMTKWAIFNFGACVISDHTAAQAGQGWGRF